MATYEEIQIGDSASMSKTISESDVYLFAGLSGDLNPMHVDAVMAAESMFGQRVAHGMLSGSLLSTLLGMKLPGVGTLLLGQNVQYRAPVFIGDTVTAKIECSGKIEERKWLTFAATVTKQDGTVVIKGDLTALPPSA